MWIDRNNPTLSEQRLADQIRNIKKNNWLSETEREEIEREIRPIREQIEDERERITENVNDIVNDESERENGNQETRSHHNETNIRKTNEDIREKLNKIKHWMETGGIKNKNTYLESLQPEETQRKNE